MSGVGPRACRVQGLAYDLIRETSAPAVEFGIWVRGLAGLRCSISGRGVWKSWGQAPFEIDVSWPSYLMAQTRIGLRATKCEKPNFCSVS